MWKLMNVKNNELNVSEQTLGPLQVKTFTDLRDIERRHDVNNHCGVPLGYVTGHFPIFKCTIVYI